MKFEGVERGRGLQAGLSRQRTADCSGHAKGLRCKMLEAAKDVIGEPMATTPWNCCATVKIPGLFL